MVLTALGMAAGVSRADAVLADTMCCYEQGLHTNSGYATPMNALSVGGLVSLGTWSDDPNYGTNDRPVGIVLGFSTSILNGDGDDLNVVGNPFPGWYEPGYLEVARETGGLGATVDGWQDETFYLLKPGNYESLPNDPRDAAITMSYFAQSDLGYADVAPGGDLVDIGRAIDGSGNPIALSDIAYIHVRTVTDDSAGMFGYYTTEINYVEALNGQVSSPEPLSAVFITTGLMAVAGYCWRRRLHSRSNASD